MTLPFWLPLLLFQAGPPNPEEENMAQLLAVHRICVDKFSGGETAAQMRDMIISSLQGAKLFLRTENQDRADAILRGSGEDLVFTDTFTSSDGISARAGLSAGTGSTSSTNSRRGSANMSIGDNESTRIAERKHEAVAAVRLVSKDGDVIWSTTQESLGAKFRGASADVADKIARQLVQDYQRAKKFGATGKPPAQPPR
jgi:hypothetical protein